MEASSKEPAPVSVLYVQRRPTGAQMSMERLFEQVRRGLGAGVAWEIHVCPFPSQGLVPRLRNGWAAWRAGRGRICHLIGDVHYLALVLPRRRFVLTIHDCAVLHRLRGWRREVVRLLWYVWPVRRAAVVTTVSETTREDLCRWLGPSLAGKVRVVPNCVRAEFVASPKSLDEAAPVVLQVGTGWNKNLTRVAEALRGLGCRWRIVGPINDDQQAMLEASEVDYECLGRLGDEELAETYRQCDVLVFVSLFEGFGLPILEAQATGRPVITSNRSSMPEVAGEGAVLVDPEQAAEIRAAIRRVVAEPALWQSLVDRGFENVGRFQPTVVAQRYEMIYKELATVASKVKRA
jgi:glycosyltransferase involved in cell wall biosynthesis